MTSQPEGSSESARQGDACTAKGRQVSYILNEQVEFRTLKACGKPLDAEAPCIVEAVPTQLMQASLYLAGTKAAQPWSLCFRL